MPFAWTMPTPNPSYDPDWKITHDYHAVERDRALAQCRVLIARKADEAAFEPVEAAIARHHEACLAAAKRQYRTLQEYAAALFLTLDRSAIERGRRRICRRATSGFFDGVNGCHRRL